MELCYLNNPQSLFRKYNRLVTSFSSHQLGRDFLGIQDKNIALLLPNGYHRVIDSGKKTTQLQMVISTRPLYAQKLFLALHAIDLASQWITDFQTARRFLFAQLGLIRDTRFPRILFDTFVVTPNAHPEPTSVDGFAGRQGIDEAWSTIRSGAGNTFDDTSDLLMSWTQSTASTNQYGFLRRTFILFDTSSFPADGIITPGANTVVMGLQGNYGTSYNQSLVTVTPASNTALQNSDFGQTGTTKQATDVINPGTFTLNSTGEGNIAKTGITKFGIKLTFDCDNSAPTWSSVKDYGAYFYSAENGTAGNRPTLTITYTLPGTSRILGNGMLLGVGN